MLKRLSGTHDELSASELVESVRGTFQEYLDFGLGSADLTGRDVLEIGPGNNFAVAILLLASGARSVVCIDRFRSRPNPAQVEAVYRLLHERLTETERERCRDVFDGRMPRTSQDSHSRLVYLSDCGIEGAEGRVGVEGFDLILSMAVLEHVASVEAAISSMERLLRPGGRMIHRVDLRSHEEDEESHPLEFLTYSPFIWRLMTSHTGESNRQRASVYRRLLEKHGFEIRRLEITRTIRREDVESIRPHLAPPFRDAADEDLIQAGIMFDARKPTGKPGWSAPKA
jgi:SAM-dependent methyltransferase